tara:strand:- start:36 stop:626 length:591 start_codon:yes stop_codon:yes gene_type:complete
MAFTSITVTGTYKKADGTTPASGNVTFLATNPMTDSSNNQIVSPTLVTGILNGSGAFSVTLTATTDTTTQPSGTTYEVTENIDEAFQVKYNIAVPHDSVDGTLDVADVTPATTPITSYNYATQQYVSSIVTDANAFTFDQQTPATTWSITHNLGFKPSVFVVDTSDNVCYGDVQYTSVDALTVTFTQSFAGKAYLS